MNDRHTLPRFTTTGDGLRIAYYVDDFTDPWIEPPSLFLLHSAMSSSRRMAAMVPHFARRFRVVRVDLRGHGATDVPRGDQELNLERLTRDVLDVMAHLEISKAHFLGASGGGYIAQQLAIHHAACVSSILLFASRPGFRDSNGAGWIPEMERTGLRAFIARTIEERLPVGQVSQAQVDWFLDEMSRNDESFVRRFVGYMTTQYWMSDLARISCPTLIVAPRGDAIGNASAYQEMHRLIRGSELVTYDQGHHNITDYLPDRCAHDALDFLLRRASPAGA
ncbi:MAG: alpha/beta hydrolase [Burkholderiales bacterium]|nr:alpha/beta hydrolase [Burkholderiales bacterium]